MRKLGAVLLLFAALCAVCTIASQEVARVNLEAAAGVREAITLAEAGEAEKAGEKLTETAEQWQAHRRFLEAVLHHETIEHAEEGFFTARRALAIGQEVFLMEAERLAVTLDTLAEGDAAILGNVL